MASILVQALSGSVRGFPILPFAYKSVRQMSYLVRRWSSYQATGSSPSQLPVPGEPGWTSFITNVERYQYQAPLSPAEFQRGRERYEMDQRFAQIEKMFSKIIKSNESLSGDVKRLIQMLKAN